MNGMAFIKYANFIVIQFNVMWKRDKNVSITQIFHFLNDSNFHFDQDTCMSCECNKFSSK